MLSRLRRLPGQLLRRNPFGGTLGVKPLSLWQLGAVTARNFRTPLEILNFVFEDDWDLRYADVPGFPPFLFVRDQELIREITSKTAMKALAPLSMESRSRSNPMVALETVLDRFRSAMRATTRSSPTM